MTDAELDDLCRKLMSYYEGPKPKPIPPITDEAADAITALRAERDQLREQVQAFRREQIARSKIDPVTRLHNLCDHLAEQRRESPFTAESLELADASYKELCAENTTLREQIIELRENIKALDNSLSEANIKRGDAEADNAALRLERDAAFALLRVCQDSVHPNTRTVIQALIGDHAMREGKENK